MDRGILDPLNKAGDAAEKFFTTATLFVEELKPQMMNLTKKLEQTTMILNSILVMVGIILILYLWTRIRRSF